MRPARCFSSIQLSNFSNLPKIVRDFIDNNKDCFRNKKLYIIATMGLFSGDGAGCSARLFRKYSATILGGLHLKMPDCIGDEKLLKKSLEENRKLISQAEKKISIAVSRLKEGNPHKEGLGFLYHVAGLFRQRLWFYGRGGNYPRRFFCADRHKIYNGGVRIFEKYHTGEKCSCTVKLHFNYGRNPLYFAPVSCRI